MTDIMKLATDYAQACYNLANPDSYDAELADEARAALQSAIEALQSECAEHKENAMRNARQAVSIRAERDQLQSKLGDAIQSSAHWQHQFTEAQAENERLNSGWHQANQEALQAKLTVQVQAKNIVLLCDDLKYIAGIARRLGMPVDDDTLKVRAAILGAVQNLEAERNALQAKLDAMDKGEPVAWSITVGDEFKNCVELTHNEADAEGRLSQLSQGGFGSLYTLHKLYGAPKALAPLTDERQPLSKVLAAVREYMPPDGISAKDCLSKITAVVDPWPLAAKPLIALKDEEISLMAHNEDEGDWSDLRYRDCWHEGYKAGARATEAAHGIGGTP